MHTVKDPASKNVQAKQTKQAKGKRKEWVSYFIGGTVEETEVPESKTKGQQPVSQHYQKDGTGEATACKRRRERTGAPYNSRVQHIRQLRNELQMICP